MSISESEALHERVRSCIRGASRGLDRLALDIARFQAAHVAPFARLVRARGVDLERASSAASIPAVPTDVFRLARVASHPVELDAVVFRTSGTTASSRGEHPLRTTATYELAALTWGERFLWPDGAGLGVIVLAPPRSAQPDSSLGFMLDLFARHLGGPASWHVALDAEDGTRAHIDVEGILKAAADARARMRPTLVLATSFALVHLLDALGGRDVRLPPRSRVMQTGGFKGRSREVDREELRALVARAFDVPSSHVVSEYGMTELSSQLYEGTLAGSPAGLHRAPPWVRVDAVDPDTLEPLPRGEVGLARILDLANVDSAVAIQTADRVRVSQDGAVEILGRTPGAVPRGCSIAIDEMLSGA